MHANVWRGQNRRLEDNSSPISPINPYSQNSQQQQHNLGQFGQPQQQQQQQQQQYGQPQQQQQQQLDLNGNPVVPSNAGDGSSQNGGQNPPMNLASVLHYLQSEWRRWERDRNEWEIERAEMRARIALLEGERRSSENLKTDLLRRVKMLEFALRQERSKTLSVSKSQQANNSTIAHSKLTSLIAEDKASEKEKEKDPAGSASGSGDSPKSTGITLPNGRAKLEITPPNGESLLTAPQSAGPWRATMSVPSRDGKSRARSRDYLKQCLQEISYLTSAPALNPLPNKLGFEMLPSGGKASNDDSNDPESSDVRAYPPRPVKDLEFPPEEPEPVQNLKESTQGPAEPVRQSTEDGSHSTRTNPSSSLATVFEHQSASDTTIVQDDSNRESDQEQRLTAIYKPESKEGWKEALRLANEQAEKAQQDANAQLESNGTRTANREIVEPVDSLSEAGELAATAKQNWKQNRQLKSHLDSVRDIKFAPDGETLVSASSDCTVKVWKLDLVGIANAKSPGLSNEMEPQTTFRGHTATVTSLAVSSKGKIFSGSMDATIRVWRIPSIEHQTYSAYDPTLTEDTLVGHTDGVWALALLPSPEDPEGRLISAGADGKVKVWDTTRADADGKGYPLLSTWSWAGTGDGEGQEDAGVVPVSISPYYPDLKNVLVGFTNGRARLYELSTGHAVKTFEVEGVTSPCNQVICHPTWDVVALAHSDGKIRFFDSKTAKFTTEITAHASAVNAIDLDPHAASTFISVGDDCSCRVWDLGTMICGQEWNLHRQKNDQGVLTVVFSDKVPVLASGGADGVIRVYAKSA